MGNIFNLQQITANSTRRIKAVPANNVEPASVLRSIETRPLQGLPRNINRSVKQVNVKNTLPTITTTKGLIDVINNFDWTTTPSRAGSGQDFKVPSVRVQEFEMDRLSVIKSIRYQIQTFSQALDDNQNALNKIIEGVTNLQSAVAPKNASSTGNIIGTSFGNTVQNALGGIARVDIGGISSADISQISASITNFFTGFAETFAPDSSDSNQNSSQWLRMLDGLYTLESSNFEYLFPYLEDRAFDAASRFTSYESVMRNKIVQTIATGMSQMANSLSEATMLSQPGVYIEQPQIMDISSSPGSDITVTFPLLNTLSYEGAVKNYQLLWLLAFQNKPYRETKTVVSPVKIYRVHIPGIKYMHFAHISNLSVDFLGVRRTVRIPMPTVAGTPEQVNVIMPDAYRVSITFKSLTTDMGNFMIEQLKRGAQF